jgi:oligopeptidase A
MFPDFPLNGLTEAPAKLTQLLTEKKAELQELLQNPTPTYNNFVVPYQLIALEIDEFFTPISHLNSVNNSEETQTAYSECISQLTTYSSQLAANEAVFETFQKILEKEGSSLNLEQKKVLENEIRDFRLGGCGLPEEQKQRLEQINLRLSELGKDYAQNIINDTNDWEMIVTDPADVRELPASDLAGAKFEDEDGVTKYRFTLHMPSYLAYMKYGSSRELREKIYRGSNERAPQNGKIIEEISKLRQEKAQILGFENFAQLSLATKAAPSEKAVLELLNRLADLSIKPAKEDVAALLPLAKKDGVKKIEVWDLMYYSRKLKKALYDVDEEYYRPYFEKHRVIDGLFQFLDEMFGVQFIPAEIPVWHETVTAYDVLSDDAVIGRIYMDLEARQGKRDGAWMNAWHTRHTLNEETSLPTVFLTCNFPPSSADSPSLLTHYDVVTLFHEVGHGIHHLLSEVSEALVSGTQGVTRDTIEFPSQFLDKFPYTPEVLQIFACHYETGEILDTESILKLAKARNFQSALSTITQVEFALFDFLLHQGHYTEENTQALLDSIRDRVTPLDMPVYAKFQHRFSHIFSMGYAAGYFSYKWAEVLSADAFLLFQEHGVVNSQLGRKYRETILSKGGSKNMSELYRDFAGRDPEVESLLRLDGIIS